VTEEGSKLIHFMQLLNEMCNCMFVIIQYCRQIWLGLYDVSEAHDTKDEQQIKDFMVAKYEKKR
jgi:hypothetical protein